ncbi:calcium/calmodulin-dependent 3',5'-cyclic nucleotide phosphodiesterase 1A-like isoform X2 [Gigantopelta aegis]|uniref:calcium/calmodulin-dependent 3',5'-cyclic nucleotide phosphodiesterase 1A-like isoform X2 n=1 Tax=Gigantopelta aegis TaxID=1735272 RepID=UPI001B88CC28|nr:calcium/calmodulin-dependent 3',5'-cyclic nucleotide phosphodiesterase 1A-like isoform X2 [Gigantopelta aegis]
MSDMELKPRPDRPRIYMSSKTHKVVVVFPNGEVVEVANPPEKAKDDSNVASSTSRNGQLSRTGSLTVLRRTNSKKTGSSSSRASSVSIDSVDSYASGDLGVDKLPPIDTPEASHCCSVRLRQILRRIEKEEISKEDMKNNLEYAASLLENLYIDETRRLCDEDDELSEVEPDAVPSEVRDWLALTFTRSMSNMKRKGEDKPKFRSVAHAIRAGIMVDRIYRRLSSSTGIHVPPHVLMLLKNLDDWSFDVFSVNEASDGHALKFVGYELLQKYGIVTKFKINSTVLESFLFAIETGYSKYKNPYHNLCHGADVAQTVHFVLSQSKLAHWLTDLEVFATIVAALIHDYEHTGTTNNFHINTGSDVALLYNDRAVLENHHLSSAFRLMKEEEYGILSNLSKEEYRDFRSLVIDMVLATDMSFHFQQIKNMKNLLSMPENIDKSKAVSLVLHCADISHPAKDWDLHKRWTGQLLEEFFRQGDREQELGLPFSPLCDRKNTLVAESQIGFIDFIVDPSFQVMGDMLDKVLSPLHQQAQASRNVEDSISEEVFDAETASRDSSSSAAKRFGKHKGGPYELLRPWVECLATNKQHWKEKAIKDAEERQTLGGDPERKLSDIGSVKSNTSDDSKPQPRELPQSNATIEPSPEKSRPMPQQLSGKVPHAESSSRDSISIKPLVKGISRKTSTTDLFVTNRYKNQSEVGDSYPHTISEIAQSSTDESSAFEGNDVIMDKTTNGNQLSG